MSKIDDGGPAFPVSTRECDDKSGYGHQDGPITYQFSGMTLRDYFAGQALAGMLGAVWQDFGDDPSEDEVEVASASAYKFADAMIAQRSKS